MYLFKYMFDSQITFVLLKLGDFVHCSSDVDVTTLKLDVVFHVLEYKVNSPN